MCEHFTDDLECRFWPRNGKQPWTEELSSRAEADLVAENNQLKPAPDFSRVPPGIAKHALGSEIAANRQVWLDAGKDLVLGFG